MKFPLYFSLMIAVVLSIVVSQVVYFGYTPNYAADIFSRKTFGFRLDHDVYKYRVLSKSMLYAVDDWLGKDMPAKGAEPRILINTPDGSERFYLAFYYLNTFFLALTTMMVVLLMELPTGFRFGNGEKALILFLVPVVIALTEFTVCCYDVSSYFFQLLILYLFLRFSDRQYVATMVAIGLLVILSTVNRESSALSVSIIGLLLIGKYGLTRRALVSLASIAAVFLITYVALRFLIVDPLGIRIINNQAGKLLIDTNLIGLLFWFLFFLLPLAMADTVENRYLIWLFFLFSLPYIITCLKDGVMWEIRLYMPLFLGSLFLSKLDFSRHVLRFSEMKLTLGNAPAVPDHE